MHRRVRGLWVAVAVAALVAGGCGSRRSGPPRSQVIEEALKDLKSDDVQLRVKAAMTLGSEGGGKEVPALVTALTGDPEPEVRAAVAGALGEINEPACLDPLIAAIKDRDIMVAQAALGAMRRIKGPKAIAALEAAQQDERPEVRDMAGHILIAIKEESQPPP